jgi:RNAse (barnase) inhibitor barstar
LKVADIPTLYIDGTKFNTLEGFYDHVSEALIPGHDWGHNLDAFNDILSGGFGTPKGGFRLIWLNSSKSRLDLGFGETVRQLQVRARNCHPTNIPDVLARLQKAQNSQGTTVYDWLLEILKEHSTIIVELQ